MKAILEKLSAYNIFSYLLPGLLFVSLGERLTSFSLIQRSWIVESFYTILLDWSLAASDR